LTDLKNKVIICKTSGNSKISESKKKKAYDQELELNNKEIHENNEKIKTSDEIKNTS